MLQPEKRPSRFLKQWTKKFFRRQLQLREQPRILTAFLFTAKIAAVKIVDIKFKRYYRPKIELCQPARVTGARNEKAGTLRKIP